jgi:membrane associated rhomboid family serine protease
MMILLVILVLGGYALYSMKPDERTRVKERLVATAGRAREEAARRQAKPEPFRDALRQRTPWPLVMPALVAANVLVFLMMGWGASDEKTLVSWGASFGPRTTNGEWWRLVSSMFVHSGTLQLLVNCAALVQLGLTLERLVGHVTFGAVYFSAGILASVVSLSDFPIATSAGASAAIFGLYGLLLASSAWTAVRRAPAAAVDPGPAALGMFGFSDAPRTEPAETRGERESASLPDAAIAPALTMTSTAARQLAPVAAIFALYNLVTGDLGGGAELAGFAAGFICGIVLTSGVSVSTPPVPRVAITMAVTVVVAVASAVPLRGVTDVRPEITRVIAVEESTASTYQRAVKQFKLGAMNAEALAQLIERKITPELHAMQARLKSLGRVPPEHQPLRTSAEDYLRLRDESWRLRAAALHKSSMSALRKAEMAERASLEAFERLKPTQPADEERDEKDEKKEKAAEK